MQLPVKCAPCQVAHHHQASTTKSWMDAHQRFADSPWLLLPWAHPLVLQMHWRLCGLGHMEARHRGAFWSQSRALSGLRCAMKAICLGEACFQAQIGFQVEMSCVAQSAAVPLRHQVREAVHLDAVQSQSQALAGLRCAVEAICPEITCFPIEISCVRLAADFAARPRGGLRPMQISDFWSLDLWSLRLMQISDLWRLGAAMTYLQRNLQELPARPAGTASCHH
mmetsp:Transcript_77765/g.146830  ORF Transcript_77765/g.146830 Transcript_77765/m.146830 type:complete len:224 (-) Transcript_77765:635-1306(-)